MQAGTGGTPHVFAPSAASLPPPSQSRTQVHSQCVQWAGVAQRDVHGSSEGAASAIQRAGHCGGWVGPGQEVAFNRE